MKKTLVLTLLFSIQLISVFSQQQYIDLIAEKQKVKALEEKSNRYFHKIFAGSYIRSTENDFDNSAYMDIEVNGDEINLTVYALDNEGYVVSTSVHGTNMDINHVYVKVLNDVYIAKEHLTGSPIPDPRRSIVPYILYNSERGVYYHEYKSENNQGLTAYGPSKAKVKWTEASTPYLVSQIYSQQCIDAINYYNGEIPKRLSAEILAKKDDGVTADFHKANLNKILFGNVVTNENVLLPATYKSKFTIDEPISMTIFSDKGFNKYLDVNASTIEDMENINGNRESVFEIKLTLSNGHVATKTFYVLHPNERYLTISFQDLVYGKGKSKTSDDNSWILKNSNLGVLTTELTVKVEVITKSDDQTVIAEGTFTYLPKANARMSYGRLCASSTDVKIKDFARIKPALTANFKKALLSKEETKKLILTDFFIGSDWQEDNSLPYKYITVYFVVKNQEGTCFSGSDQYLWFDPKSLPETGGYFFKAESKFASITPDLYPFCDCK